MAVFNPSVPGRSVRENRKALVWSREISVAHFRTIALATRILVDLKKKKNYALRCLSGNYKKTHCIYFGGLVKKN